MRAANLFVHNMSSFRGYRKLSWEYNKEMKFWSCTEVWILLVNDIYSLLCSLQFLSVTLPVKEIKPRLCGRNFDGDSAGMLSYIKDWKILADTYTFSNAICLLVFLITGIRKWFNFSLNVFCFFRIWFWIGQHDPFLTNIDKFNFVFKVSCCLWIFSRFVFNERIYCINGKNGEMTQR